MLKTLLAMSDEFTADDLRFSLTYVRTESRILIQSTCRECGALKLVSVHDGSLRRWHAEHACKQKQAASGEAADGAR